MYSGKKSILFFHIEFVVCKGLLKNCLKTLIIVYPRPAYKIIYWQSVLKS